VNEFRTSGGVDRRTGGLAQLPWAPAENFLGLPEASARFEDAAAPS